MDVVKDKASKEGLDTKGPIPYPTCMKPLGDTGKSCLHHTRWLDVLNVPDGSGMDYVVLPFPDDVSIKFSQITKWS